MIHWAFLIPAFVGGFACCYGLKYLRQRLWEKVAAALRGLRIDKVN